MNLRRRGPKTFFSRKWLGLGKVITLIMPNMSAKNELDRRWSVRLQNNGALSSDRHGAEWVWIDEIV